MVPEWFSQAFPDELIDSSVCIVVTVDGDGHRRFRSFASDGLEVWNVIGLLETAKQNYQGQFMKGSGNAT